MHSIVYIGLYKFEYHNEQHIKETNIFKYVIIYETLSVIPENINLKASRALKWFFLPSLCEA